MSLPLLVSTQSSITLSQTLSSLLGTPSISILAGADHYSQLQCSLVDPSWKPFLDPTPDHRDYLSTHTMSGAAAGAVTSSWNGGDEIDFQLGTNVTRTKQIITRRRASAKQAVEEDGDSRIFGGIHFQCASDVGSRIRWWVGEETL